MLNLDEYDNVTLTGKSYFSLLWKLFEKLKVMYKHMKVSNKQAIGFPIP